MSLRRMQNELQQWGQWARATERHCGLKQYVSPAYTLLKQKIEQPERSSGCCVHLNDDALLAIDNLVGMLKLSRPDLWYWVNLHYLKGLAVAALAKVTGMARYKIDECLTAAETWLDCRLESLCESLDLYTVKC